MTNLVEDVPGLIKRADRQRADSPSFRLQHRLYRALWSATWFLLASWTPAPLHPWRAALLRLFGARIGRRVRVYGSALIWYPPNLVMDDGSVLGRWTNCYNQGRIVIGESATVSQYSHLVTGTHDIDDPTFQLQTKPIYIGPCAWIAACAFVGPGVTVGAGAVLGARSTTFSDLDPWWVYVGAPAHKLRRRKADLFQ